VLAETGMRFFVVCHQANGWPPISLGARLGGAWGLCVRVRVAKADFEGGPVGIEWVCVTASTAHLLNGIIRGLGAATRIFVESGLAISRSGSDHSARPIARADNCMPVGPPHDAYPDLHCGGIGGHRGNGRTRYSRRSFTHEVNRPTII